MYRVFAKGLIIFYAVVYAGVAFAFPSPVIELMRSYIRSHDVAKIKYALRESVDYTVTLDEVRKLADVEKDTPLKRAIKAAVNIDRLDVKLDMSLAELVQITYFIETELKSYIKDKKYYLSPEETLLSRTIEYDPQTGFIFIHLDMKNTSVIGLGAKKRVTQSILYDHENPEVLARLDQHEKCEREIAMSKKLKGVDGVLQVKAYTERKEANLTFHTMFCKFYRQGTIFQVLRNDEYHFSLREKMHIALTILKGLEGMQRRNIVHKDLHHHNYLVNITKKSHSSRRDIEVVIADLGLANYAKKSRHDRPQGDTNYAPPEAFIKKLTGKDYYATDLFAVGCLFYQIFYEKYPSWQRDQQRKHAKSTLRAKRLYEVIETSTAPRRALLESKSKRGGRLTTKEEFELLILHMVNPDPKKRLKTKQARRRLENVMKRHGGSLSFFKIDLFNSPILCA